MTRTGNILSGTRYPWTAEIVGDDLVVTGQFATWFGGSDDQQDDGSTASGISTKRNPAILGCALPLDYGRDHDNPCAGSPFPKLPWFTNVEVTNRENGQKLTVKLIDLGPSAPPEATAAIDLSQAAFVALGGSLRVGRIPVDYRVIGGAKLLGRSTVTVPLGTIESEHGAPPDPGITITPTFGPTEVV